MSTNINSTEQIVEINAGDQITNVNIVSQSTTQVISGEQVVTVDVNAGTIPAAWGSITGTLSNQTDLQNALNAKQNNITLTTTGTSGAATLVGSTLNIPNYTDTGLTSVGLAMPSAFNVSNSPLTTNGTITVTGAGTGAQYIKGDGTLATFPTTTNEAKTLIREVYNKTGATLTKGTVVYINGGQGNLPTVTKAIATGDSTSAQTFGIVQTDITNMNNGFVVVAGGIENLNTQAYPEGTALYLSPTTAGVWTSTKPYAPNHMVYLGVVVRSHPTQGVIEVKIINGFELSELHDVSARFPNNADVLSYDSSTQLWIPQSIPQVCGFIPVPETRILTINGVAQNLNADRTWNVGTVTSIGASAGTGISVAGSPVTGSGTITITNTAPDQIVSLTGAGTTSISGTYPNFTITSNDQYVGTVTSVNATVPTGFEVSGVPITTSGTVDIKFASGYSLPTNAKQAQWDDAYAKRIDSLTVTGNSGSSTLVSNVLNVPTYTLTGLGGEPAIPLGTTLQYWRGDKTFQTLNTGVVPESGNVYFTEPRVRATVLSGLNITGGSISASDSVLNAFGKVQNQINGLIGGSIFQSTWNASTNTPSLASGVGTKGYYYIVSVAGTTNLDGITDWQIGDWAIFDGTVWRKVDNTDAVVSVNGYTGVVNLVLDDLADVSATSSTDTQLLRYNGTTSKWYNWTPNYQTQLTNPVTGTGTINQLAYFSATGSTITSNGNFYIDSATGYLYATNIYATTQLVLPGTSGDTNKLYLSGTDFVIQGTFDNLRLQGGINNSNKRQVNIYNGNTMAINVDTTGVTTFYNIPALATAATAILVSDSGTLKYRTPAEIRSDIGAQGTLTFGNLTESTSSVLTITGGTGAVIGSGTTIEVKSASTTQNGIVTTGTQSFSGAKTFNALYAASIAVIASDGVAGSFVNNSSGYEPLDVTNNGSGVIASFRNSGGLVAQFSNSGSLKLNVPARSTAATIFLTTESTEIKSRTAAQVLSDIGAQAALTNPVTGTGTANQIAYFSGTSTITSNSNFTINTSTGAVTSTLVYSNQHLYFGMSTGDDYYVRTPNVAATSTGRRGLNLSNGVNTDLKVYAGGNTTLGAWTEGEQTLVIGTGYQGGGGSNDVILFHSTGVGNMLAISAPNNAIYPYLPLAATSYIGDITMRQSAATNISDFTQKASFSILFNGNYWNSANGSTQLYTGKIYGIPNTSNVNPAPATRIVIQGGSTDVAHFHSTGNASIGTSTDSGFRLDVNGTGRFQNTLSATAFIPTGSSIPTNGMYLPSANTVAFAANSTRVIQISDSGRVSIGATTPTTDTLTVHGAIATTNGGSITAQGMVSAGSTIFGSLNCIITSDLSAASITPTGTTAPVTGIYTASSGELSFSTGTQKRFSIASSGAATFSNNVTMQRLISSAGSGTLTGYIANTTTAASGSTGYGLAIESEASAATSYALTVRNLAQTNTYFHIATETGRVGNIGIGTASPSQKLTIDNSADNTIFLLTSVSGNTRLVLRTDSSANAQIRTGNSVDLRLGVNEDAINIKNGGNVLIGTTTDNGGRLQVSGGDVRISGGVRFSSSGADANRWSVYWNGGTGDLIVVNNISDIRAKKDFDYNIKGLETIQKLKPLKFTWKDGTSHSTSVSGRLRQYGFIAQETMEADDFLAWYNESQDSWGIEQYESFSAVIVKAIQEQQAQIEELKSKL